jgi:signal transduction histidine kinase
MHSSRAGRLTTRIEVFDARAVAADVLEELRPYAEEKGLELRLAAATDLSPESSDPELVRLILLNLVGNAIKFTEHGLVEVSITSPAGVHRLTVRDSGPGIPAADRIRIFEAFAQMGDVKQKHVPGMGRGLRLVREVASALGGDVELDSEVGRGSTFTVTLPPMARESQQGAPLH